MHCSTLLQIAAHFAVLTIAAPAPQDTEKAAQFNPTVLSIQPDNGGSPQDDCGKGALLLNPNTWNAHGMDDRIRSFWDQGVSNPNFDFHQAFASQYSVDLSCPDSFTNCLGDPSSCSALSGDVASKEQGWLGIKSILQVQALFLQVEKAISNVFDGIAGDLVEFQDKFTLAEKPKDKSGIRTAISATGLLFGIGFAFIGVVAAPANALASTAWAAIGGNAAFAAATGINNHVFKDGTIDPLQITNISDQWNSLKYVFQAQIDHMHSAAFSNGKYNGTDGPKIVDYLTGGGFAGSAVASAYEESEASLQNLLKSLLASKLLEAAWRAQGAFIIYIPKVTSDCPKWKTHAGKNGERRLCTNEGMYIMNAYDRDHGFRDGAAGMDPDTVKSWAGFKIDIHDLIQSSASVYQTHGLGRSADLYDFVEFVKSYQADPAGVYKHPSVFTVPVCELKPDNWRQSDGMGTRSPPCDCLNAADKWGNKFMDATTADIQDWIKTKCSY